MSGERDHIVQVPPFFFFLRIAQAVLTLVVFILACYGLSFSTWVFGGNGYALFVSLASFVILGYYLLTTLKFPSAYNRWAVLVLECFAVIWWLACWADLAAWAAAYSTWFVFDDFDNSFENRAKSYRDAMAAGAGIGALNWVLWVVTLVTYGIFLHRHRNSGAPDRYGQAWTSGSGPMGGKDSGLEGGQQQQYPMYAGPGTQQQDYAQQGYQNTSLH
ncbi:hypothetical protein NA57DRAFT_81087 [Rhizodiscina lignyota]|uniref:MARVEL domain-containing protein n=1 Tax=Rhizodiscina lignyota TaxID=1504668 RepID=A0A9P4I6F7_9PEZI|nr:hypothetical protein NA57DRAFT_81087 [Rhizodiscina lignyota]